MEASWRLLVEPSWRLLVEASWRWLLVEASWRLLVEDTGGGYWWRLLEVVTAGLLEEAS